MSDEKPFKFDPSNHRIVTNVERPATVAYAAGIFWLASVYAYRRRYHRVDGKTLNFAAFSVASIWASYQWSSFFFSSANIEAGLLNNERELHP